MATTNEDIIIRAGMDQAGLARGLQTMRGQVQEFATTGKMGFLKARDGAEAFQTTISKLTRNVPILGTALHAMLSPVGAVLTATTLAFTYFTDKIAKWNAEMDAMGEENAKPIGNIQEALRKAKKEMDDHQSSFRDWQRSHTDEAKEFGDRLKEQLADLKSIHTINSQLLDQEKEKGGEQAKRKQQLLDLGHARAEAQAYGGAQGQLSKALLEKRDELERLDSQYGKGSVELSQGPSALAGIDKRIKDQEKALNKLLDRGGSSGETANMGQFSNSLGSEEAKRRHAKMAAEVEDARRTLDELKQLRKDKEGSLEELGTAQGRNRKELARAQGQYDSLYSAEAAASSARQDSLRRVRELEAQTQGAASPGYIPMQGRPDLDARTGGIPYKAIQRRTDLAANGGIKLRPLPGDRYGHLAQQQQDGQAKQTNEQRLQGLFEAFVSEAMRNGLKINVPDE